MDWPEKNINWWGEVGERTSRDRRLTRIALILIILSFALAILTTAGEFIFFRLRRFSSASPAERKAVQRELRLGIHPLKLLPTNVAGFSTITRQQTPGMRYSAEAIYVPENEDLAVRSPANVYVRITYYSSEREGLATIKQALKDRYGRDNKTITLEGQRAYSGYETNYGSYYLAWTWDDYSIEINTSFTQNIPARRETVLPDITLRVAESLMEILKRSGI